MENFGLRILAEPDSHGSIRMVKDPGKRPGEERGAIGGVKVRRKVVSPLRAFTVRDMTVHKRRVFRRADAHGDGRGGRHQGQSTKG